MDLALLAATVASFDLCPALPSWNLVKLPASAILVATLLVVVSCTNQPEPVTNNKSDPVSVGPSIHQSMCALPTWLSDHCDGDAQTNTPNLVDVLPPSLSDGSLLEKSNVLPLS